MKIENFKRTMLIFLLCVTFIYVLLGVSWRFTISPPPCACETCLSEDDPWFMQRSNKSVEPFLRSADSLSEDAFNWWKRLQNEGRDFSIYRKTVENLFQMFPPSPDLTKSSPDHCRTCAVVGNSGNLRQSHYGPLIDLHDVIIRMNRGETKGYERDVGTRTTHRIMYPESAMDLDNTTHLVLVPFKIQDLEWLIKATTTGFSGNSQVVKQDFAYTACNYLCKNKQRSYAPVKSTIKVNKDLVMVINPAFMKYVHDTWLENKGGYPSTGFMALVLALHICDEVYVFGYGADKDGNWNHYWESLKNKQLKTGLHPGTHEYNIIKKLADKHKLKFYVGW